MEQLVMEQLTLSQFLTLAAKGFATGVVLGFLATGWRVTRRSISGMLTGSLRLT